jgi:epoxide hydrolase-like predicted phosphatase
MREGDGVSSPLKALVVDFGGVLTTPLSEVMNAWVVAEGLDPGVVAKTMYDWIVASNKDGQGHVHGLETGELASTDFEIALAAELERAGGGTVQAQGLLARMFAGFREEARMTEVLLKARAGGFKTGLLSNSWGNDYPRESWDLLFDAVVISGEVGLRKPDPAIYLLAAQRLNLDPGEIVFVDDLSPNVRAAAEVGMVGIHHTDVAETIAELEKLLGMALD